MDKEKTQKIFDSKYEILEIVGRGETSVVYHAKRIDDKSDVALKVLLSKKDEDNREKLRRESLALVSCRHENVIKLEDFQTLEKVCYLVMEYAKYKDIIQYLNGKVIEHEKGIKFLKQALRALDFIHQIGFIHRDITPENLLVMSGDVLKLSDFGSGMVVYELSSNGDLKANFSETPYVAPEYFNKNEINFYSDIYSLGMSFFYLFTHSLNFNASLITDKKLSVCLAKMLEQNPQDRFRSAKEVLDFLEIENIFDRSKNKDLNVESNNVHADMTENKINVDEKNIKEKDYLKTDLEKVDDTKKVHDKTSFKQEKPVKEDKKENNKQPLRNDLTLGEKTRKTFEDLNKEKLEDLKKTNTRGSHYEKSSNKKVNFILYIILLVVIYFLLSLFGFFDKNDNKKLEDSLNQNVVVDGKNIVKLTFPRLVDGLYYGEIFGVLLDKISFSLISKDNNVFFDIKEEGFTPIMFFNDFKDVIEVSANGVVLVFNAKEIKNNMITGEVLNKITGEKGTWRLNLIN